MKIELQEGFFDNLIGIADDIFRRLVAMVFLVGLIVGGILIAAVYLIATWGNA